MLPACPERAATARATRPAAADYRANPQARYLRGDAHTRALRDSASPELTDSHASQQTRSTCTATVTCPPQPADSLVHALPVYLAHALRQVLCYLLGCAAACSMPYVVNQ
jgi:hypothetical protein